MKLILVLVINWTDWSSLILSHLTLRCVVKDAQANLDDLLCHDGNPGLKLEKWIERTQSLGVVIETFADYKKSADLKFVEMTNKYSLKKMLSGVQCEIPCRGQ